jgi:hypothetical protein
LNLPKGFNRVEERSSSAGKAGFPDESSDHKNVICGASLRPSAPGAAIWGA